MTPNSLKKLVSLTTFVLFKSILRVPFFFLLHTSLANHDFFVGEISWFPNIFIFLNYFFPSAVNTDTGVVDAYQHMAPMVDTVTYMQWLYKQCRDKGCRFVHDEIHGLLRDQAEDLKRKYKAQLIFNCSGLSAKELAGDEDVYPLRGK